MNHEVRQVYGPFHRLLAPGVQDAATVVEQGLSGEIWGRPPRWGSTPQVKAYPGPPPDGASGIELWSFQRPDSLYGPRGLWYTDGPFLTVDANADLAKLKIAFVRITQACILRRRRWESPGMRSRSIWTAIRLRPSRLTGPRGSGMAQASSRRTTGRARPQAWPPGRS